MRTVGLVLFRKAFILLLLWYCLPAVRPADQVFSPAVRPNCPADAQFSVSGPCATPTPTYPHATLTPSHRRYTRQDPLDIGAASSSSAGPLSPADGAPPTPGPCLQSTTETAEMQEGWQE